MTICNAIRMVVEARQRHRTLNAKVRELKQEFAERHADLLATETLSQQEVMEAETTLRTMALEIFQRTGEKTVHPGVKIREVTKLTYDLSHALAWAMEHRIALRLDEKAFEKIAKATPLSFVRITVEPQATLARCFDREQPEIPMGQVQDNF